MFLQHAGAKPEATGTSITNEVINPVTNSTPMCGFWFNFCDADIQK